MMQQARKEGPPTPPPKIEDPHLPPSQYQYHGQLAFEWKAFLSQKVMILINIVDTSEN